MLQDWHKWGIIKMCTGWKRGHFCTLLKICIIQFTSKINSIFNCGLEIKNALAKTYTVWNKTQSTEIAWFSGYNKCNLLSKNVHWSTAQKSMLCFMTTLFFATCNGIGSKNCCKAYKKKNNFTFEACTMLTWLVLILFWTNTKGKKIEVMVNWAIVDT